MGRPSRRRGRARGHCRRHHRAVGLSAAAAARRGTRRALTRRWCDRGSVTAYGSRVIRTRVYRQGSCTDENFDPERISDYLEEDGTVVWMDVDHPTAEQFALIAEEFDLNPLAVEDALHERQRPKLDHYDDHVFISLYDVSLDSTSGQLSSSELAIFASPRYLITVRKDGHFEMDQVVQRWDDAGDLAKHGVGFLLWGLLDVVVDNHFVTVQQLDDSIEDLEDLLFDDTPRPVEVQIGRAHV